MSRAAGQPVLVTRTGKIDQVETLLTKLPFQEAHLQDLIHRYPGILPIAELEPAFGDLIPVCCELNTPHGPIDNLLVTPEGNLILVEVKLWRNPEARRKVVAQALDYASCLFEMNYEKLEEQIMAARHAAGQPMMRLYDLVAGAETEPEASFIDAVNINLRRGRMLILVVGDGIRTETERLVELVQHHAGAHLTFALIELALYGFHDPQEVLVCPRTLAKTYMIPRGIIEVRDNRMAFLPPPTAAAQSAPKMRSTTITAEQFFEAMNAIDPRITPVLQDLIDRLEPLGVYPDFKSALSFKWDAPTERTVNFGYIQRNGQLWTSPLSFTTSPELGETYARMLATAFEIETAQEGGRHWYVAKDGRAPRIQFILSKLPNWVDVIQEIQRLVRSKGEMHPSS